MSVYPPIMLSIFLTFEIVLQIVIVSPLSPHKSVNVIDLNPCFEPQYNGLKIFAYGIDRISHFIVL